MKIIDAYIIKKFLGTFAFTILLIIPIIIIFDLSENLQTFIERKASVSAIFLDYYLNFVPFLINQLRFMKLVEYLKKHSLTHKAFGEMIGVSQPYVTNILSGK